MDLWCILLFCKTDKMLSNLDQYDEGHVSVSSDLDVLLENACWISVLVGST
jgi:hypothetical protein